MPAARDRCRRFRRPASENLQRRKSRGGKRGTGRASYPTIWPVRLRDMLTDAYERVRGSQFRMHYQYVMANDRRAPYDYFMLVCGPVAVTCWAKDPDAVVKRFGEHARYEEAGGGEARSTSLARIPPT